jgi:prepilin-type N-terminal cleavage/methylation domain-containing protein
MRAARPVSGFTLIELLIVIGILALVLALGAPSILQTVKKDSLGRATSDVVDGCNLARAQAILRGTTTEFVIRAADGRLAVRFAPTNAAVAHPPKDEEEKPSSGPPNEAAAYSRVISDDIAVRMIDVNLRDQMGTDEVVVRFFPNGTSDEFTLVLEQDSGIRKISLECVTGLVDVEVLR